MKKSFFSIFSLIAISFVLIFNSCDKDKGKEILNDTKATVTTIEVTDINPLGAICGGVITNTYFAPIIVKGVVWTTSDSLPTLPNLSSFSVETLKDQDLLALADSVEADGLTFHCTMRMLPNKTYKVRAFVYSLGVSYGEVREFATSGVGTGTNVPEVTTGISANITKNSAVGSGNVTNANGTILTKGVCWGTKGSLIDAVTNANLFSFAAKGSQDAAFTSNIKGLLPNTTYEFKAFAINADGIGYGSPVEFKTPAE
ncbi:MAG: fibronectin type III domain-containing protein [Bacteroidales bacterium]|jgi:hypothetical protein|nr:fibronectin type III domain-containing protein [Bacteroidales bacterium]